MHEIAWPFWNFYEKRLRAGWRIIIQLALWLLVPAVLNRRVGQSLAVIVSDLFPDLTSLSERITLFSLTLITVLVTTWLVVRYIDHRPLAQIGLRLERAWWIDLVFGMTLGALLMTVLFLVELTLGWVVIRDTFRVTVGDLPFWLAILGPLFVFVVVGITEEILSRGYQLRNLAEGLNFPSVGPQAAILFAWVISSLMFGLLHVFNPNATMISTLYLTLAGMFFGLGYVLTGRLGLPIGLHIAWNFFQGNVYGFPVSGNDFTTATVFAIEQRGPTLWTGGAFGPEAGYIGIAAILLGCLLTVAWVRRSTGETRLHTELAYYAPPGAAPQAEESMAARNPHAIS
jgi:membrane protease YdiL (CAAX protease family)